MNSVLVPAHIAGQANFSLRLRRNFSAITDTVIVHLNAPHGSVLLCSGDTAVQAGPTPDDLMQVPGNFLSCHEVQYSQTDLAHLTDAVMAARVLRDADRAVWRMFSCRFDCGIEDRLALILPRDANSKATVDVLSAIWPILREDCLRDLYEAKSDVCDKAMLWMIASKIDVSILVMNSRGVMLRANAAAKHLLEREDILRRTPNGIHCVNPAQTRQFRAALAQSANSDPCGPETVIFLDSATPGLRVPVTMSRFWYEGTATDLVAVMMPTPPDSRRVEMLARANGLTPAEARVASLLQMGLSNKDAARVAGLKEQSVSTYAKRVLNKLHVTSRAEMAQMLTWQAGGGHLK